MHSKITGLGPSVRKILAPIKIQSALPPPPQKTKIPPPKTRNFMDMAFFLQKKNAFFQAPIKLAQPFPAPELRQKMLRTRGFFWFWVIWNSAVVTECGGGGWVIIYRGYKNWAGALHSRHIQRPRSQTCSLGSWGTLLWVQQRCSRTKSTLEPDYRSIQILECHKCQALF